MKTFLTAAALVFWVIGSAGQQRTNCLSLLLLTNKVEFGAQTDEPGGLTEPATVFSDADFVEFNVGKHTFTLTAEATQRLTGKLWEVVMGERPYAHTTGDYEPIPGHARFVLVAFGKPVYSGIFCPGSVCSYGHADGVPRIVGPMFIKTNLTGTVSFEIYRWPLGARTLPKHDSILEDRELIAAARALRALESAKPKPN